MKYTKEQIDEMKQLRKDGVSTYEIARKLKCSQGIVCYHTDKTTKQRHSYAVRAEYYKDYHRNRYNNDPEFKSKQIKASIKSNKARAIKLNDMKGGKKNGR